MHQTLKATMQVKTKVAGTLLLVLIVWSISSASLLSLPSEQGRASGCPMHRQSSQLPSPSDHSCCQSGHDTAVLQSSTIPQHDGFVSMLPASDQKPASSRTLAHFRTDTVSPGTPPSRPQLRI